MKIVTGDRIRSFVWVKHLWYVWKCSTECHEFFDFLWWGAYPCKFLNGAVFADDLLVFMGRNGFVNWESEPHV